MIQIIFAGFASRWRPYFFSETFVSLQGWLYSDYVYVLPSLIVFIGCQGISEDAVSRVNP